MASVQVLAITRGFALAWSLAAGLAWAVGDADAGPLSDLGDYERKAVDEGLRYLGLEVDAAPEGKVVGSIWVINLEIFGPDAGPLRLVNYLHRTTRPVVIEREVLLRPGDPMDWDRLHESERRLTSPLWSMVVVIVPVKTQAPGTVDLLVVTRDGWSLRTDSFFEVQNGVLSRLSMEPSEFNFLGLRKQLGLIFDMDLGRYMAGPLYRDPNILGTRLVGSFFVGPIFGRESGQLEGSASDIEVEYPLWSLASEWGARVHASHQMFVSRLFQDFDVLTYDAPETPEDDALPWAFDMRQASFDVAFTRAYGEDYKHRISLAQEVVVQRPGLVPGFPDDEILRQAFVRDVLPRSERTSSAIARYQIFRAAYGRYRNVETFDVGEDEQLGIDATVELGSASRYLGSETDFWHVYGTLGYTHDLGGAGYARLAAVAGARLEHGQTSDIEVDVDARVITPPLGRALRLVARARMARRFRDQQNIVFPVGGQTGLRGYIIGAFVGPAMVIGNVEVRTSPVSVWFMKAGAVAFWDVGHAAASLEQLQPVHDIGLGVRLMVPQFGRELLRLDWAVPLARGHAALPGRISIAYKQAF